LRQSTYDHQGDPKGPQVNPTRDSTSVEVQRTLADLQRSLADAQCELAERTAERDEALEYQAATSDVLKVISRSTFDLHPVLDTLLETGAHLCRAEQAVITLHNSQDGLYHYGTSFGYGAEFKELLVDNPVAPGRTSLIGRTALERQVVHIEDAAADPDYKWAAALRLGRWHTGLGVPLLRDGSVLGVLALTRRRVERFTDKQIELIKTFADQAVIVIENARLLVDLRESEERYGLVNLAVAEGIYEWDIERNSLWVSSRLIQIFGFEGRNLTAADWNELVHPEDFARYRSALRDCFKAVTARLDCEYRVRHSDGEYRWVEDRGVPVRDMPGRAVRLVGAVSDISERKAADQALHEALEQQTATAEVLQVINASPGDLAPVFDAMLEKALNLCEAVFGVLWTYDGARLHMAASRGDLSLPEELVREGIPTGPENGDAPGRLLRGEPIVHIADIVADMGYQFASQLRRILLDSGGRTLLAVPLWKDSVFLGYFAIYRREVRSFTDKQIALLQNFAAQAVIAMENARLLGELRQRTTDLEEALEYQTATSDVLQIISRSTFDLQSILDTLAVTMARLCNAEMAFILRRDGEVYRAAAAVGWSPEYKAFLEDHPIVPSRGTVTGRVILEGRAVHIEDIASDPEYVLAEATILGKARTQLGVPLVREGMPIGVIVLARQRVEPFTEKQIELVVTFADQAVIAIENVRLITETREALEQQTATAEILRVISSSGTDVQPVFDAIVERTIKLCDAEFTAVARYQEDGLLTLVATNNLSLDEAAAFHSLFPRQPTRGFIMGRAFLECQPVNVEDVLADPNYDERTRQVLQSLTKYRSFLGVPIIREGRAIGVIGCARREVRPFTSAQIELVGTFADQAVIAIENARLLGEIQQRQAELRVTFDNMADGVVMFDAEHRLAAWNRNFQELLDLADAVLAERPSYADYLRLLADRGEFGTDDIEAELRRRLQDTDKEFRLERTRPDGRVIEVRRNAVPDGGFVLIYSDITERKRSEAEVHASRDAAETALRDLKAAQANLIQAEKMASLGQLTAGIAHEIKNPLNFVNNFASLSVELLDELKDEAEPALRTLDDDTRAEIDETLVMLTGNLEKIAEHGRRADNIVKSMLEHSRGVTGERRSVDLNRLVEEALNLAFHGARAQNQGFNIILERDYAQGLKPIDLAPQEITRVFLNLFGNGFYAANQRARERGNGAFHPVLAVATREADDAVEVRVRDNGTGIPPEIKDKLFQPFFTTKPTGEGTGLGLSISYDIVTQQHGGSITVESEPGSFTEFIIRLPRH
jgi:two-component system NtrC family sensor kinase